MGSTTFHYLPSKCDGRDASAHLATLDRESVTFTALMCATRNLPNILQAYDIRNALSDPHHYHAERLLHQVVLFLFQLLKQLYWAQVHLFCIIPSF